MVLPNPKKGLNPQLSQYIENGAIKETFTSRGYIVQTEDKTNKHKRIPKNSQLYQTLPHTPEAHMEGSHQGFNYAVYELVEGEPLKDIAPELTRGKKLDLVRETAKVLGELHQAEANGYGWPTPPTYTEGSHDNWREFLQERTEGMMEKTRDTLFEPVANQLIDQIDLENVPQNPESSILHNDYHDENIMANTEGEVTGVIDLDNALIGDRLYDFVKSRQLITDNPISRNKFLHGYLESNSIPDDPELMETYEQIGYLKNAESGAWTEERNSLSTEKLEDWRNSLLRKI